MTTEADIGFQQLGTDVRLSGLERRAAVLEEQKKIAVLEERIANHIERAKDQNVEVRRRLDELNHAHDKQVADQATYVSREVFDRYAKDEREWREQTRTRLDVMEGQAGGRSSSGDMLFKILPLLLSLGAALYAIFVSTRAAP